MQAAQQGIELEVVMMEDWLSCIPDYYTPVIIAAEATLVEQPEVVGAFLEAVSRGFEFAIDNPAAAADILIDAVPELDQHHKKQAISTLLQTKKMKTWKFYKPVSHSFDL